MGKVQFIKTEAGEELAVLSRREYEALLARAGDEAAEDAMTAHIVRETAGEATFPAQVWDAIDAGDNPVKVIRLHRRMTQMDLSDATGIKQSQLSGLEKGEKGVSLDNMKRIAKALDAPLAAVMGELD